jgi:hypothetical protein
MLIKTKDVGIKTRSELISFLYIKKSREGSTNGKLFEVNDRIVEEVMVIMSDENKNEESRLGELSKFITLLNLEEFINLDKLFEKINSK